MFGFFVGIFGVFSGDLGVILSCKITRGMILVVGKVTERVQGGLRGFWGVYGVVKVVKRKSAAWPQ